MSKGKQQLDSEEILAGESEEPFEIIKKPDPNDLNSQELLAEEVGTPGNFEIVRKSEAEKQDEDSINKPQKLLIEIEPEDNGSEILPAQKTEKLENTQIVESLLLDSGSLESDFSPIIDSSSNILESQTPSSSPRPQGCKSLSISQKLTQENNLSKTI